MAFSTKVCSISICVWFGSPDPGAILTSDVNNPDCLSIKKVFTLFQKSRCPLKANLRLSRNVMPFLLTDLCPFSLEVEVLFSFSSIELTHLTPYSIKSGYSN